MEVCKYERNLVLKGIMECEVGGLIWDIHCACKDLDWKD